ncbi:MAG: ABC transporter ATP-binding protein [Sphingobacteriaceae bacterium]
MQIILENIGRRFNRDWIFRNIDYVFENRGTYAVLGANGSGKSTLLQVLSGSLAPSSGKLSYHYKGIIIDVEVVFEQFAMAAPYMELIEEFTLEEMIDFHFCFKRFRPEMDRKGVIELLGMNSNKGKLIKYFSSGMKQRAKLALAFCSDTPMLLLDEPTANLDVQGVAWYLDLIATFAKNRLTIICSNQQHEFEFCEHQLNIQEYKTGAIK